MTTKDFYIFGSRNYLTTFYATADIREEAFRNHDHELARKINYELEMGIYDNYKFPIVYREENGYSGKKMRDVLDNRNIVNYLISDRMRDLLINNNITGWKCYEIEMYDKKGNIIPGYSGFSTIGKCNSIIKIDYGNIVERKNAFYAVGAEFEINEWDGSDIFRMGNSGYRIITRKVRDLFKKNKITAIKMDRLTDYECFLGWTKERALARSIIEAKEQNERIEAFEKERAMERCSK